MQDNSIPTSEPLMDMVIPLPKYKHVDKPTKEKISKTGKIIKAQPRKEFQRIALINNLHKWFRFQKTEVKNNYKELLKDFYISEPTRKYRSGEIEFIIHRDSKAKLDSDAIIFAVKWFTDSLVETGHLVDDDRITYILKPSIYTPNNAETQLRVIVKLAEQD